MVVHACDLSARVLDERGLRLQGHPQLHKDEASLKQQ